LREVTHPLSIVHGGRSWLYGANHIILSLYQRESLPFNIQRHSKSEGIIIATNEIIGYQIGSRRPTTSVATQLGSVGLILFEGTYDGECDGNKLRKEVGKSDDSKVGVEDDELFGTELGSVDGTLLGRTDGSVEGILLGVEDGVILGIELGMLLGVEEGEPLGIELGSVDGTLLGKEDGSVEGILLGIEDGVLLGIKLGNAHDAIEGTWLIANGFQTCSDYITF